MHINDDGSVTVSKDELQKWVDEKKALSEKAHEFEADMTKLMVSLRPVLEMLGLNDPGGKPPSSIKLMQMIPKLMNNPGGMFNGMGEVLEKYAHLLVKP